MNKWISFFSLMIVLFIHFGYIAIGKEFLFDKKQKLLANIFMFLGVIGSILCIVATRYILTLHLIIIFNFLFWMSFLKLKNRK